MSRMKLMKLDDVRRGIGYDAWKTCSKRRRRASFATNKDGTHKRRMDGTVERRR
jgi:hypothetical protein